MIVKLQGDGVKKNLTQAVVWYTSAANQGHLHAQNNLGVIYQTILKDDKQALRWFQAAAEQGDGRSMFNLGRMYSLG